MILVKRELIEDLITELSFSLGALQIVHEACPTPNGKLVEARLQNVIGRAKEALKENPMTYKDKLD